jgi:hypothetical protein
LPFSLLVAAATLVAGASLAGASATAPVTRVAAGVQVLDLGQVRLHVPSTWVVAVAQKVCGHGSCRRQCAPGYDERVYVSTFAPQLNCPLNFRRNSVWVVPSSKKGATKRQTLAYDGGSEILTIPSEGVTLYGFGKPGVRAVNSEEPSTLARLLASRQPVAVPSSWPDITDGVVTVAVPPTWAIHALGGPNAINPGTCGSRYFPRPAAFVGSGTAVVYCPFVTASGEVSAAVIPGNGAWLVGADYAPGGGHTVPFSLNVALNPPGTTTEPRTIHGLSTTIGFALAPNGTDVLLVTVVVGGRSHYLVLGLGLAPTIAEQILSSLRAS